MLVNLQSVKYNEKPYSDSEAGEFRQACRPDTAKVTSAFSQLFFAKEPEEA
jgi:hypothetical protein